MKIKQKQPRKFSSDKAKQAAQEIGCPEYPVFSFRHITDNSAFNLDYFNGQVRAKEKCLCKLFEKLAMFSSVTWRELLSWKSSQGIEFMSLEHLNFRPAHTLAVSKDQKFISARFHSQDFRIIAIKCDGCPILHIIGFDFDFSAYDHGS